MKSDYRAAVASRLITAAVIFIGGCVLVVVPTARPRANTQQTPASTPRKAVSVSEITVAEIAMPVRAGESLTYRVEWAIFPIAAAVQMGVVERENLFGWQ